MRGRTARSAVIPILKTGESRADTVSVHSPDGTAAVVGGALVIVPPAHDGRPAVVRAEPGIELVADGRESGAGPVEAAAPGGVEARLTEDAPRVEVRIEVTRDELGATMSVERLPGTRYRLEDQPPNHAITLRRLVAERVPCAEPTLDDLRAALDAHGIVYGVLDEALERLGRGAFSETVARGTAPVQPEDASITLLALDGGGAERFVRAGTLLAQVARPKRGQDGVTVTGEALPVPDPRPAELRIGDGVIVEGDGRVVATLDGHARIADGVVAVAPALVHEGDVRGSHGEISSPGSIRVTGSVEDGLLRAKRSIAVDDAVRRSTVEAGHTLAIGGPAFDSVLRVGHTHAALEALQLLTGPLARDAARLQQACGQLISASRASGRDLHPLRVLVMVMERVAPDLEQHVRGALAEADRHRGSVPYDMLSSLRAAQEDLDAIRIGRLPLSRLGGVAAAFEQETARLAELTAVPPSCTAPFLQKCAAEVIGTLHVTGKGALESNLRVRGRLELAGEGAILRGGVLDLDGTATVAELAPGAGDGLTVVLAPGSVLEARVVHPGVRVELPGGRAQRLAAVATDVRIAADDVAA
jgi:hypothetical protein